MTNSQKALIELVSISLGEIDKLHYLQEADWTDIIRLSRIHDVAAIAFDGYKEYFNSFENKLSSKLSLDWIGNYIQIEHQIKGQISAIKDLVKIYKEVDIVPYVLKGMSLSVCYPKPFIRSSCDFDCFLIKREGYKHEEAYEEGNRILEGLGINVDRSYYKNSSFYYHGLHVENHRFCCSIKRGKSTIKLEQYLQNLIIHSNPSFIEGTNLALPPILFQALFLIEHANAHFLFEKMSLKNICDWAMFRKFYCDEIEIDSFNSACATFGLKKFLDTMNHLADYIIGDISYDGLNSLDKRVLEDTMREDVLPNNQSLQRLSKAKGMIKACWKFKALGRESMFKELLNSISGFLFYKKISID